jgi:hypothetical protein
MTATVCAWCTAHSTMTPVSRGFAELNQAGTHKVVQGAFVCSHCHRLSIGTTRLPLTTGVPAEINPTWWSQLSLEWTPQTVGGRDFPDVPEHIASAADEAFQCRSINVQRSAILMARSVIEATCKDKGVTKGQLAAKIDEMTRSGFIRPFTQDAAHELRFLGNDMAHGDFVDDVDADDADAVLDVMAEILNEVYQGPARAGRMKAKREAAKQAAGAMTGN